jgi:uncharacterized protein (TIGR02145 family)/uncharacterized repeat protein (TIGR02543 family)
MAQVPQKMTYQAVVRNSGNSLVANQNVSVRLSILQGSAQGASVYVENHAATTNENGLMTVEIGGGVPTTGVFANIDWASGPYYLKSEIDPAGGINYSIESVQQLLSVPYALYAKEAGNGFSGDYNDLTNKPTFTESQILSISNDTIYLTGGSFVKLPAGFDGDYNSLTNKPNLFSGAYNDLTGKPNLAPVATTGEYSDLSGRPNLAPVATTGEYSDLSGRPNLAPVATSGNYSDLTNKPTLFDGNYNSLRNRPNLAPVAISGSYSDLINKPTLFDGNYNSLNNKPILFSGSYNDLTNKPTLFDGNYNSLSNRPNLAPVAISGSYGDLTNKPNFATVATSGNYNDLSNRPVIPAEQVNADWNATSGKAQIMNKPNLAPVATSGNYNDLSNRPAIPAEQVNADWNATSGKAQIMNKPNFATVATSGNYNDLTNKPTIPTVPSNVSAFQNDAGYITSFVEQQILSISNDTIYLTGGSFVKLPAGFDGDYNSLTNKPNLFSGNYNDLTGKPNLAPVATSGSYNDITGKPNLAPVATSGEYNDLTGKPNLAPVATSGNYNDLSNRPTIPAEQVNADWNATSGKAQILNKPTIPTVPANVSAFQNDAGYITQAAVPTNVSAFQNDAGYITMDSVPSIPTNVSAFANDAGYVTVANVQQAANIPTNVSAFQNDAGYLTSFTEQQILSISNDTIYLSGGSFVKLPAGFDGDYNSLTNKPNLFSGAYDDLTGKPNLAPVATSGEYNDLTGKPNLAPVATSGNYNDLSNRPTIPAAQVNSDWNATSGKAQILNKPSIPTVPANVSAFQNDAGYLTSDSLANTNALLDALQQAVLGDFVCGVSTVTDYEGNTYNTVKIGNQCWMKENLRTSRFSGGYPLVRFHPNIDWDDTLCFGCFGSTTTPSFCPPGNDENLPTNFGYLYNESAVDDLLCPDGWHVPNDADWSQLISYVKSKPENLCGGNSNNIAKALAANDYWETYCDWDNCIVCGDASGRNATGFSAVPAGTGSLFGTGSTAVFWGMTNSLYFYSYYSFAQVADFRGSGQVPEIRDYAWQSVRCLRDNDASNGQLGTQQRILDSLAPVAFSGDYNDLSNRPAIPAEQVNADWNATSGKAQILNKPNLATVATSGNYNDLSNRPAIPAEQVNADWNATSGKAQVLNKPNLATVATSGNYNDLSNLPTIPAAQVNADWNATSGKAQILNKPTNVSAFTNDAGYLTSDSLANLSGQLNALQQALLEKEFLCGVSTITDVDGNIYNTVKIGNQCWMKENLRTTHYADSTAIPLAVDTNNTNPCRRAPNNDENNVTTYGYLYNWPAVMHGAASSSTNPSGVQGICPTGWHVPSDAEWTQLTDYVSSCSEYQCEFDRSNIAKALAATSGMDPCDDCWATDICVPAFEIHKNNATGFTALPAGNYGYNSIVVGSGLQSSIYYDWSFASFGYQAYFWSTTRDDFRTNGRRLSMRGSRVRVLSDNYANASYSVRCLRDNNASNGQMGTQQGILDSLAPVAFSGSYNDLSDKPTIPAAQVNADWNATSGKAQILNKPTIPTVPTNISAFTNDAGYLTAANVQQAANIPTNVSAFNNDAGYITASDVPAMPRGNHVGDMLYWNGSAWVVLPAGQQGQHLVMNNNIPTWQNAVADEGPHYILFNANGGSGSMSAQFFPQGVAQTINANTFVRNGYMFTGWNTAADGSGTSYAVNAVITLTSNITLYAQWTTRVRVPLSTPCDDTFRTRDATNR